MQLTLQKILYSFPVVLLWSTCAFCNWRHHLQLLSPHGLHWPTVDEGLDTAALTSVSLMFLGRRNATTGGSGSNLASVSLFSISFQWWRTMPEIGGGGLTCPRGVFSSCSTSGTRRVTLVEKVRSYEWGRDGIVISTNGTYLPSFVSHIFRNVEPN